jgi:hypothetical protein
VCLDDLFCFVCSVWNILANLRRPSDLGRLAYYSLFILILSPIASAHLLSFWEIIRLFAIVAGVTWLFFKRAHLLVQGSLYGGILVAAIAGFALLGFGQSAAVFNFSFVFKGIIAALIFIGAIYLIAPLFDNTRCEKIVLLAGCAILVANIYTHIVLGFEGGQVAFEWWLPLVPLLNMALLVIGVFRLLREQHPLFSVVRIVSVSLLSLAVVLAIGVFRIAGAYYHSYRAVEDFTAKRYIEAKYSALHLGRVHTGLRFAPLSIGHVLDLMAKETRDDGIPLAASVTVATIAESEGLLDLAIEFYKNVLKRDPNDSAVRAKLSEVLFGAGKRLEAVQFLREGTRGADQRWQDLLALGLALSRMDAWTTADIKMLHRALDAGHFKRHLSEHFPPGQVVHKRVDEVLPREVLSFLKRLTIWESAEFLRALGIQVFHPAMEIGATGVLAPISIRVRSGAARTFHRESISVGGREMSAHKYGYNIVVIDQVTGRVDTTAHADTKEGLDWGYEFADFLNGIPKGKIVAGAIYLESGGGVRGRAKAALKKLGVCQFPGIDYSHAFIGVQGAEPGEAVEGLGDQATVSLGVAPQNLPHGALANIETLEIFLRTAAKERPGSPAVYIENLQGDSMISVARP